MKELKKYVILLYDYDFGFGGADKLSEKLKTKKIKIALVYSGINAEYQGKIASGVVNKAKRLGYDVAIFAPYSNTTNYTAHDYGEENIYELIDYEYFDVVVVMPRTMTCEENTLHIINSAKRAGTPVITIEGNYPGCNNIQISTTGISEIVEHLINVHNIVDFMFVGAFEWELDNDRLLEYKNTLARFGLYCDDEKILFGNFSDVEAGIEIKKYVEAGKKLPEAIVCANDTMAIGVINELRYHGIFVPEDVIVTGFDGIRLAHANNPSLTTVSLPFYECGEMAVEIALEVTRRSASAVKNYEIKNSFTISESCGCFEKDRVDDNNLIRQLYNTLDRHTFYSKRLIRMSESLTGADTLDEAFDGIKDYVDDIYVDRFYICIPEKFESCIVSEGLNISKEFRHTGYPERMIMRVAREFREYKPVSEFDTKLMIPAMHEESEKSRVFFFTPIHFQDRNFGYICLSCDDYIGSDALFNIWRMNLSIAIENARIRQELSRQTVKLENLYIEDSLTGIYNRRGLQNWAFEILSKAVDSKREVMIFVADLDGLKTINDKFGHKHGDNAIIQVARGLQKASVNGEICARFGGDEFEVIAYDYSVEKAEAFTKRFNDALDDYNQRSGMPYKVGASCGFYVSQVEEGDDFDGFIFAADKEMYKNKAERKAKRKRLET